MVGGGWGMGVNESILNLTLMLMFTGNNFDSTTC